MLSDKSIDIAIDALKQSKVKLFLYNNEHIDAAIAELESAKGNAGYFYKGSKVFENDIVKHLFEYVLTQVKDVRSKEFPKQLKSVAVPATLMCIAFKQFFKSVFADKPNLRILGRICAYALIIMADIGKWEHVPSLEDDMIPISHGKLSDAQKHDIIHNNKRMLKKAEDGMPDVKN